MEKGMEKFKGQSEPPALISSCSSQNISGHVPCQMLEWILSHKQLKMDFAINAFLINAFQSLLKENSDLKVESQIAINANPSITQCHRVTE
ncbi:hypothetical protein TREES_T100006701 [Tupaia chinensis]|uniref:Uncharacterized protein n=1 Tax=Tupaia chinensis TaxID=246437 RepID=L9KMN3_TUPCH|nr:hypothetical protein TREES_T100006701 [Tupaia chinensis]